ncbi:hypothetical protein DL96DRAFT_1716182 [Flagelloscypha sp. PMI_526]|nr:hypothetical protein DL96DRAFT_1716182 [Flagelloscypha sp. PMI_526]
MLSGLPNAPHPFMGREDCPVPWLSPNEHEQMPRTIVENKMVSLSWALRQKHDWHLKIKNDATTRKWKNEALASQVDEPIHAKLTERMVDYTLQELHSYAKLADLTTGITHACDDAVFWSKNMISDDLKASLLDQGRQLEDIPEEEKDWHPGSNKQVLDLVHPSLYPIVYGKSCIRKEGETKVIEPPPEVNTFFTSPDFCWIPSDFAIAEDGTAKLISPYINNVHPSNASLMKTIEKLVTAFVPMWEHVLGSVDRRERPDRLRERPEYPKSSRKPTPTLPGRIPVPECIWGDSSEQQAPRIYLNADETEESDYADFEGDDEHDRHILWLKSIGFPFILPDAPEQYDFALEQNFRTAELKGHTLQVIVKLANIVLTPENPEYEGGSWHVEGMLNERIVSTGIYYYDSSNITPSHLSFRTGIHVPVYHHQDDYLCNQWLYGLDYDSPLVEERGSVPTEESTCIGFPNIYQHRVSSFKLADPTKPGHRKIVALFLVDPSHRIPSATDVLMQQEEWVKDELLKTTRGDGQSGGASVETESLTMDRTEGLMSRQEAEEVRLKLINERGGFVEGYNDEVMGVEYNFCEH